MTLRMIAGESRRFANFTPSSAGPVRLRLPPTAAAILVAMALACFIAVQGLWSLPHGTWSDSVVRSDVKGYYGYLQAIFIRNDLGHEPYQWEYVRRTPQGTLNKYFCGTAVMMAPWFAAGRAFALLDAAAPRDGLSDHEMRAISIGALAYMLLGLLALRALLRGMGLSEWAAAWTLLALGGATQLLQYAAIQPGWSHVYSFCLVACFLLLIQRFTQRGRWRDAMLAAVGVGRNQRVRPVNGLVLLAVPVVAGRETAVLWGRLRTGPLRLFVALLIVLSVVSLQPILWHAQVGRWFAYGYAGEGFHWNRPEVLKVLFGFRRGLFLWAPVLVLALAGSIRLLVTDRWRGAAMAAYWLANTYVISAWWIWYYGSGFGSRVFVDHYPVLAIPMALLLEHLRPRLRTIAQGFIAACSALLLFQMWQYHVGILHHECMDRSKYAYTFLRWQPMYRGALGGCYQAAPYNPNGLAAVLEESCDLEHACAHWSASASREHPGAFSPGHACVFDGSSEFGLEFKTAPGELPLHRELFLEVGVQRFEAHGGDSRALLAVIDVRRRDGTASYYGTFPMNPLPGRAGEWQQLEYRIPVPALQEGEAVGFYFWDPERKAHALLDDAFMRISAVNPY
jgi:hypothetical protein